MNPLARFAGTPVGATLKVILGISFINAGVSERRTAAGKGMLAFGVVCAAWGLNQLGAFRTGDV